QAKPVTIDLKEVSILKALSESFKDQSFNYVVDLNTIVVTKKEQSPPKQIQTTIKGRVLDETNQPLPGATVKVKGQTKLTLTDADGAFSFAGLEDNAVLIVSYTGYFEQEVQIQNGEFLTVTLQVSSQRLEEIVF